MSSSPYWDAHRSLEKLRGRASTHTCRCGKPAQDWAYQHTAGENELVQNGFPFSLNPEDYLPMCRPCHAELDQTGAKIGPKTSATQRKMFREDASFRDMREGVARTMTENRVLRAKSDPEFKERLRASSVKGATTMAHVRRKCSECGMVSHPVGIGKHQKASGHAGWVVVP